MHEGLERARVKRHLLVFALAAPVMAIVTFLTLNVGDVQGGDDTIAATGVAMLFSAGTFLHVATIPVLPGES
jgi:zinc transporter 9